VKHKVPGADYEFELSDDLWSSAEMEGFFPTSNHYATNQASYFETVMIEEIEPPLRKNDKFWFRNQESVIEVLRKMRTGEELEPIEVWSTQKTNSKKYRVRDGFHRFYLSVAVGYRMLPIKVNDFDMNEFLEKEQKG